MNGSIRPRRSIISSVAGCVVAARGLSSTLDSASRRVTAKPFWAHARAATTPTGPAPTTMMRGFFMSVTDLAEIVKHSIFYDSNLLHWRRCISTAADESRDAVGYDCGHGRNITIAQRIERVFLRSAKACIEHHDVRVASWPQESTVQAVHARVVACSGRDGPFHRHVGEAGEVGDHVQHSKRHDSAAGWCIRSDEKAIELIRLAAKITDHQRGSKIAGGHHLHRDLAFINEPRIMLVRHRHGPAVHMERNMRLHGDKMFGPNTRRSRYRRPAGVNGCNHSVLLGPCDQGHVVERCLNRAETRLCQPHTLGCHFLEILFGQPWLEDDRSGVYAHSAWTVILVALERCESECFHAFGVCGPPGHMNFGRCDCRCDTSMRVALEKSNSLLPRCVVAKGVVHLRVDQAGNGNGAVCINDDIAVFKCVT